SGRLRLQTRTIPGASRLSGWFVVRLRCSWCDSCCVSPGRAPWIRQGAALSILWFHLPMRAAFDKWQYGKVVGLEERKGGYTRVSRRSVRDCHTPAILKEECGNE